MESKQGHEDFRCRGQPAETHEQESIRRLTRIEHITQNTRGWLDARTKRESALREIEGDSAFDGQQVFLDTAASLAEEKRLSRKVFVAQKIR